MLRKGSTYSSIQNPISTKLLVFLKGTFSSTNQGNATTSTAKDDKIVP